MSGVIEGAPWPLAVLVWPLLLGLLPALPRWRRHALRVLPLAPLPALGLAVGGASGTTTVPDLLLGVQLAAAPGGALLLGMTAAVWAAAGLHAALTIAPGRQGDILAGFWCLTLAGNLGVFLAADVVTFYVAFAAVSLAAWFLVVHERTAEALRAGKVYIVMAVAGEAALLIGLLIGVQAAGSTGVGEVRAALGDAPFGTVALALMLAGFGIKAGLVPLHVWLPLAHPAAPVPGSAVLSGAIVKAGLIGVLVFLPDGTGWETVLVATGIAGTFAAALWGVTQQNPKAVLAYSTVSQMGLMLALAGAGQPSAAWYALHHGLAKAALFLLVGTMAAAVSRRKRWTTLALAAVIGASVAGLPPTGGALAKAAAKDGLAPLMAQALTLSAATTALALVWFLHRLSDTATKPAAAPAPWQWLMAGPLALTIAALLLPWLLWEGHTGKPLAAATDPRAMLAAVWPLALGVAVAVALIRRPVASRPPGDLLDLLAAASGRLARPTAPGLRLPAVSVLRRPALRQILRAGKVESTLSGWQLSGWLMLAATLGLALLLVAD